MRTRGGQNARGTTLFQMQCIPQRSLTRPRPLTQPCVPPYVIGRSTPERAIHTAFAAALHRPAALFAHPAVSYFPSQSLQDRLYYYYIHRFVICQDEFIM